MLAILLVVAYIELVSIKNYHIPFFTMVSLYYFLFYGLFSYYAASNVQFLPYGREAGIKAVVYTIAFIGFQFAGYFLALRFFQFQPSALANSGGPTAALKLSSWTLMAGYFIIYFILQYHQVPSLPQLKQPSWYFAFSTLTFLSLRRQLSLPQIVALALAFVAKFSINLMDGLLTPILFDALIVLVAALSLKSYRTLIVTSLVCVLLFGSYGYVKYFSRTLMNGKATNIYRFKPDLSLSSIKSSFDSMTVRSSHLLLAERVIERTPAVIPFDNRNPFIDTLVNHVPRVLWPSKPREVMGNKFGKLYGIINQNDKITSWNIPWAVDFYMTFGPFLSVFNIFIVGGVFGFCIRWLSSRADRPFWFGVYSATLLPLFYQESNFSVMTGSVFSVLIFLMATYWAAKKILRQHGDAPV